ncbi:hypothetical protein WJX81_004727 [Elliptochloris bilobata]|uniref:DNA-directed DNA polymerase n=1 Tax=Elliptochloris bilobata TaxID=381761 RepID=A0AAW1QYU8_9CHLO
MYPWQAAALECGEAGANLVYCAPTSGGKSLVAEVLLLRRLLAAAENPYRRGRKVSLRALFVVPYVSVVAEKAAHFEAVLRGTSRVRVRGYHGNDESGQPLAVRGEALAVCTIEKANVTINRLIAEGRLDELCCVVIDELHMVSDPTRGPPLELALAKLLRCSRPRNVQLLGMSATMGGLDALCTWLVAQLFVTNFRPVPLTEHAVFQGAAYRKGGPGEVPLVAQRELPPAQAGDPDRLAPLIAEALRGGGGSVLVFCSSRRQCQSCAALVASLLPRLLGAPNQAVVAARAGVVEALREAMGGFLSAGLEALIPNGVAYHHAGLTMEERAHVEAGYRAGHINVLMATSTLAAGINLPAKRVILRSLWQGIGNVERAQYLQMVGRAGRTGQAASGESFLLGRGAPGAQEWVAVSELLHAPLPVLRSGMLAPAPAPAAVGTAHSPHDVKALLSCTLAWHQARRDVDAQACQALAALRRRGLLSFRVRGSDQEPTWAASERGRAVYESALPTRQGERLYEALSAARSALSVEDSLHLVYILQPEPADFTAIHCWTAWHSLFCSLPASQRGVASRLGIDERSILKRIGGSSGDAAASARHARFAAAVAVSGLLCEQPAWEVAESWGQADTITHKGVTRGQLQKMQADLARAAGMGSQLAGAAGWWGLDVLLAQLALRAAAGARPELHPLMQVPGMLAAKARALHSAGIADTAALAAAPEDQVRRALAKGLPRALAGGPRPGKAGTSAAARAIYGGGATAAMTARSAKSLQIAAREHVLAEALAEAERLRKMEEASDGDASPTAGDARTPVGSPMLMQAMAPMGASGDAADACARVTVLGDDTEEEVVAQCLAELQQQRQVAFALVLSRQPAEGADVATQESQEQSQRAALCTAEHAHIEGMAFCWSQGRALFLDLSQGAQPRCAARLLAAAGAVLRNASVRKAGFQLRDQLAALLQQGIQVAGGLDDAAVAGWLLQPATDAAPTLRELQALHAPRARVRVPPLPRAAVAAACRAALLAAALAAPLRALLHAGGMLQVYDTVEMRLLLVLAAAQARGVPVYAPGAARQLREAEAAAAAARRAACAAACRTIDFDDPRSREAALDAVDAGCAALGDAAGGGRAPKSVQGRLARLVAAGETGSRRAQLLRLLLEADALQSTAAALAHLLYGFMAPADLAAAEALGCLVAPAGAGLAVAARSVQEELHALILMPEEASGADVIALLGACGPLHVELAALAHLSGCAVLAACLRSPDPIAAVAARWLAGGAEPSAADVRKAALALAALASGSGRGALAEQLGIARTAVLGLLESLLAALPGVQSWWTRAWVRVEEAGWVATAGGRRWPVPGVGRLAPRALEAAKHSAFAAACQGSAADICKAVCLDVAAALAAAFPRHPGGPEPGSGKQAGQASLQVTMRLALLEGQVSTKAFSAAQVPERNAEVAPAERAPRATPARPSA